jgi:hypothetical protein
MTFKIFSTPRVPTSIAAHDQLYWYASEAQKRADQIAALGMTRGRDTNSIKSKNEGRIFRAWCGGEYVFRADPTGRLMTRHHGDFIRDWRIMERELAKELRERRDKSEYFAKLHETAMLEPSSLPRSGEGRMTVHPIPLDWD